MCTDRRKTVIFTVSGRAPTLATAAAALATATSHPCQSLMPRPACCQSLVPRPSCCTRHFQPDMLHPSPGLCRGRSSSRNRYTEPSPQPSPPGNRYTEPSPSTWPLPLGSAPLRLPAPAPSAGLPFACNTCTSVAGQETAKARAPRAPPGALIPRLPHGGGARMVSASK